MSLQQTDVIYIKGYKTKSPSFYCEKHFRGLIGFPTRVLLVRNDEVYVTHPELDTVPLDENCVDYVILNDINVGHHHQLKKKLQLIKQLGMKMVPIKFLPKIFNSRLNEQEEEKKMSPSDLKILNIINKINDGELLISEVEKLFGSLEYFISFISKKGLLNQINPFSESFEDIQNLLLYEFVKIDPSYVGVIAETLLSDITKIGDDYYLDADYSELSDLFRKTGSYIRDEMIEKILSGEYDIYEYGGYGTDDEYRDIYGNLDHYNKSIVDEFIVNELKAMEILKFSYYKRLPEFFEEIAEEQGTEKEIKLTDEVIVTIMKDKDCLEYLINKELDEVRSNLNSIYSSCYGDTLVDEWYNSLWGVLEGEVVDDKKGEDYQYQKSVWLRDGTRGTKTAYGRRYKVTKCLFKLINGWLEHNKNKNSFDENTIEYFGGYIKLMKDAMEYGPMSDLRVPRLDDYPDYRKMNKCMNENVESYF